MQPAEFAAFVARWNGTYVEDRLRNDWLLELMRRRDRDDFAAEYPRFRMNDDREVTCFALAGEPMAGKEAKDAGMAAWLAQKDGDDGCAFLGTTMAEAKLIGAPEVWKKIRASIEVNRPRAARQAADLLSDAVAAGMAALIDSPARYLARKARRRRATTPSSTTIALIRLASTDSESAAALLASRWERALPGDLAAYAWAGVARQSAIKLQPEAANQFQRAVQVQARSGREIELSDDTLAWKVRAALRADKGRARWQQVIQAINAMTPAEQKDAAWVYWKAEALQALARDSQDGEALLATRAASCSRASRRSSASTARWPPRSSARPGTAAEARAAHAGRARRGRRHAGLRPRRDADLDRPAQRRRARVELHHPRPERPRAARRRAVRLRPRGLGPLHQHQREDPGRDRPRPALPDAAAQGRRRREPREIGLDPAFVYGLIRQESRFIADARSGVGASGLMQLMPSTARWTAKKIGLPYTPGAIVDRDTNLRLGNAYLKLVLDDAGGSQAMAAAAYNAGPGRPRKWRDGPVLDAAVWVENIPFPETRDYVKKVLSNSTYYAALLGGKGTVLRSRLGKTIGPADPNAPPPDKDLP